MERKIIQPNRITTSKYEFSKIQKNILYHIIGHIQDSMTMINHIYNEDKNVKFTLKLSELDVNKNYSRIKEEGKKLIGKAVEYDFINSRGRETNCVTTLISSFHHEHKSDEISVIIPPSALPFLCYVGDGFTQYRKTIAISLNSMYSKRMYELCCKWIDKEGFTMRLEDLRKILNIENKHEKLVNLKKRVLDHAQTELEEKADVWFSYTLEKVKSRSFNVIHVKIHSNELKKKVDQKDLYSKIYVYISNVFPENTDGKPFHICDKIAEKGDLKRFYDRMIRLDDDLTSGKINGFAHFNRLVKKILKEDYNI